MSVPHAPLFLSHGAPDLVLQALPARDFLAGLGQARPRPRAVVVASAHYDAGPWPCVTVAAAPRTIHDFGGFDPRLYQLQYAAPGAPSLATALADALTAAGFAPRLDDHWGFDHGTWVPLMLMYPEADIPVVALSVHANADPAYHLQLGRALAGFAADGVLVIGSGALTHNLAQAAPPAHNTAAPDWVHAFADWAGERLAAGDEAALLDYRRQAPGARENHPSEEHLLPLFVALGAAGPRWRAERLHSSVNYRILRMDMFAIHGC